MGVMIKSLIGEKRKICKYVVTTEAKSKHV